MSHLVGSSQQPLLPDGTSDLQGQSSHIGMVAADSPMAAQNAFPNESSAQARQLVGSPEHVAEGLNEEDCRGGETGNTELKFDVTVRRRRGTAG